MSIRLTPIEPGCNGGPPQILALGDDSYVPFGAMDTGILDTRMLDDESRVNSGTLSSRIEERWRRSRSAQKLVEKGVAFCKAFSALCEEHKESCIAPSRLTKISDSDIGAGGAAAEEVHWLAAENGHPPVLVTVKQLQRQALRDGLALNCLFREAATLRRLKHRHLAGFIGVGNFSAATRQGANLSPLDARKMLKSTFVVQQFVGGRSLRDVVMDQMVSNEPLYTHQEACVWMRQVAEGLAYLHSSDPQVLHCDLKLDNILLRKNGAHDACLANFGLSVFKPSVSISSSPQGIQPTSVAAGVIGSDTTKDLAWQINDRLCRADKAMALNRSLTSGKYAVPGLAQALKALRGSKEPCASFMYMAPEVLNGEKDSDKSGVFSFGCCLYEVFARAATQTLVEGPTGDPYAAKLYAIMVAQGYRRPLAKTMAQPIRDLIAECWAHNPEQRPQMADVYCRLLALENSRLFLPTAEPAAAVSRCGCCVM